MKAGLHSIPLSAGVAVRLRERGGQWGWPLLTVENEANGDSKSTNERVLPWLVNGALSADTKVFLSYLGCSSRSSKKNFFHPTLFQFICSAGSPVS
jgi:hypothetical protein